MSRLFCFMNLYRIEEPRGFYVGAKQTVGEVATLSLLSSVLATIWPNVFAEILAIELGLEMKEVDPEVKENWLAEARRRWKEFEDGKVEGIQPRKSSSESDSISVKPAIVNLRVSVVVSSALSSLQGKP